MALRKKKLTAPSSPAWTRTPQSIALAILAARVGPPELGRSFLVGRKHDQANVNLVRGLALDTLEGTTGTDKVCAEPIGGLALGTDEFEFA